RPRPAQLRPRQQAPPGRGGAGGSADGRSEDLARDQPPQARPRAEAEREEVSRPDSEGGGRNREAGEDRRRARRPDARVRRRPGPRTDPAAPGDPDIPPDDDVQFARGGHQREGVDAAGRAIQEIIQEATMPTLAEIAALLGCPKPAGADAVRITGMATLPEAGPADVSF